MAEYDPFATTSGLPDKFIGEMKNSEFLMDPDGAGKTDDNGNELPVPLILRCDLISHTEDVEDGMLKVKVGDDKGHWEVANGGKEVVRDDGKDRNYHENSYMGLFVTYALNTEAADHMRKRFQDTGLTPFDAEFWDGWVFYFERIKIDYGKFGEIERLLPVRFEGLTGETGTKMKGAAKATASVTKKASPKVKNAGSNGKSSEEVRLEAFNLAYNDCDSPEEFVQKAMETLDLDQHADVLAAVEDGTIWTEAVEKFNADQAS